MGQTYCNVWLHYIWSTKNREPIITPKIKFRLYDQIRDTAIKHKIHLDCINGIEDHVHSLISMNSNLRILDPAKILKGNSSHWVNKHELIDEIFDWQDGYSVFSVSPSNVPRVRAYIFNQEKHHATMNLETELKLLIESSKGFLKL